MGGTECVEENVSFAQQKFGSRCLKERGIEERVPPGLAFSKDHNKRAKFISFVLVVTPAVRSPAVEAKREVAARILCMNAVVPPRALRRNLGLRRLTVSNFRGVC